MNRSDLIFLLCWAVGVTLWLIGLMWVVIDSINGDRLSDGAGLYAMLIGAIASGAIYCAWRVYDLIGEWKSRRGLK